MILFLVLVTHVCFFLSFSSSFSFFIDQHVLNPKDTLLDFVLCCTFLCNSHDSLHFSYPMVHYFVVFLDRHLPSLFAILALYWFKVLLILHPSQGSPHLLRSNLLQEILYRIAFFSTNHDALKFVQIYPILVSILLPLYLSPFFFFFHDFSTVEIFPFSFVEFCISCTHIFPPCVS